MTTAVQQLKKLQPSSLLDQGQLRQHDLDLSALKLALGGAGTLPVDEATIGGDVERTIDGASTITISLEDRDKLIGNSGRLGKNVDIKIDGLWFRLVSVAKTGFILQLTFEDREVSIMRTYNKYRTATRGNVTRAQFVKSMVTEVKELKIPFVCPELTIKQKVAPIEGAIDTSDAVAQHPDEGTRGINDDYVRGQGFAPDADVVLFNHRGSVTYHADANQKANIDAVLRVGANLLAPRKVLVSAIEVVVEEDSARNTPFGDRDSVGMFQQRTSIYGTANFLLDINNSAAIYFKNALKAYADDPSQTPEAIAVRAQVSGETSLWLPYRQMAERVVSQWGVGGDTGETAVQAASNNQDPLTWTAEQLTGAANDHQFSRGVPTIKDGQHVIKREDTWECSGRMADEVHWRRFMVSGSFYFISEPRLFRSRPRMTLSEDSPGVDSIDYRYDVGQAGAEVTVQCRFDRWNAPPGSTVDIKDVGPVDGRWLVTKMSRPLFDNQGTITLSKPRPTLAEPKLDAANQFDLPNLAAGLTPGTAGSLPTGATGDAILTRTEGVEASQLASQLIQQWKLGNYRDDNGRQIDQLKKVAAGQQLTGSAGPVDMDPRVLGAMLSLIGAGFYIGSFALCEDHSHLGAASQHSKGQAVDISLVGKPEIGWHAVNSYSPPTTQVVKDIMDALKDYHPWDIICNGNGRYDPGVQAHQVDNGKPRSGVWVDDHINHIHFGVAPGVRD